MVFAELSKFFVICKKASGVLGVPEFRGPIIGNHRYGMVGDASAMELIIMGWCRWLWDIKSFEDAEIQVDNVEVGLNHNAIS